jgi:IclR family transcriptional regulator, pca regulon regulatory protein
VNGDEPVSFPALGERRFSLALQGGLAILSCFTPDRPVLGTSELAGMLGMSVATTHRLILTLADQGYLEQAQGSRAYRLSLRATELGMASINETGLCKHARPHLERLSARTRYTVALGVLDGPEVLLVDLLGATRKGQGSQGGGLKAGSSLPVYCTAIGKVLLAHLPADRQSSVIAELDFRTPPTRTPPTPKTVTSEHALREQLARTLEEGLGVSDEELLAGSCAVAAPIRDESGDVVAGVSVLGLGGAIELEDLIARFAGQLEATAQRISTRLGWSKAGE